MSVTRRLKGAIVRLRVVVAYVSLLDAIAFEVGGGAGVIVLENQGRSHLEDVVP
jgi:hypothetical protein